MNPTKKERQAYHPPQVIDYGNVKQITMAAGFSSIAIDGGRSPQNKTR